LSSLPANGDCFSSHSFSGFFRVIPGLVPRVLFFPRSLRLVAAPPPPQVVLALSSCPRPPQLTVLGAHDSPFLGSVVGRGTEGG